MENPFPEDVYLKRTVKRKNDIRGYYFRDQTAIIHSMAFRRLKNKTQVFFAPENDHVCTRIEHVLHVATVAATICKGLNEAGWKLDTELAYAIGLGHDLGHTPFGHSGESMLNQLLLPEGFKHEINSYRVVEFIANGGKGLNLTYAVKDGIINHNGEKFEENNIEPRRELVDLNTIHDRNYFPCTYEGCIIRFADKIAYLGRDIEDAITAKFISEKDIPDIIRKKIGTRNGEIINHLALDLVSNSKKKNKIGFSDPMHELIKELGKFNYDKIYRHPEMLIYEKMGQNIIKELFEHFSQLYLEFGHNYKEYQARTLTIDKMFGTFLEHLEDRYKQEGNVPNRIVTDYIAGMTDLFALDAMQQIKIPRPINFNKT
jgi:dGTPase